MAKLSEDLAYIGGVVDGEGYIGIKRSPAYGCQGRVNPGFHAKIQVRMVSEEVIKFLADHLHGWYYKEKTPSLKSGRPLFCYQATDLAAEKVLTAVLPYLKVKRKQAETVLALRNLQREGRKFRTKQTGTKEMRGIHGQRIITPTLAFSDEYVQKCQNLYEEVKRLNH